MAKKQPGALPPKRTPPAPARSLAQDLAFPSLQIAHPLEAIFRDAVDQARKGKGDARHGNGREFMKQTWLDTANAHGPAFLTGQAEKKLRESNGLEYPQRRSERLGALVYIAMSIIKDDIDNGSGAR